MQQATTADAGTSTTVASSGTTATTTDANTSTAATAASAGTPALQAPSQLSAMDRELKPWGLFVEWLEAREEVVGNYSLRDLRARVCSNAWDVGRVCYVQVRESCAVCGSSVNLFEADWQREVAEQPLGEAEQAWLAKYIVEPEEVA
ncbi:hypothetical protein PF004_g21705 [Phytophthora fragariae]|uniref:Uncharacterized protein n=1 Tax=Phytophthora fragariae TaxID=53985 RepID=A0A6G0N2F5_9STRA|nr:hypothetical protein PF004_g21705 [Phytophthora fragariae]